MDALNQLVKWANENMAFNLTARKKSAKNVIASKALTNEITVVQITVM